MGVYSARGNSSRSYLYGFLAGAGQAVQPGELVLDAGAGRAPYRGLFAHAGYETADFLAVKGKKYTAPDYVCDLAEIPVDDARFDHVVLTQVLEHVPEPAKVLAELHRVLKPGGTLWLTAPLFYAEHERPYDFFRYTQFGLRHLLESAGFEVLKIDWMEGYLGTLSYQARVMSKCLPSSAEDYGGGLTGLTLALAAKVSKRAGRRVADGLAKLDLRFKFVGQGLPKNYQVVARK
ncbi:MAG: class I SAM-dependent methyltransferase [Thermoleophilaceae bacterium]|nr:class I SAM-dependent methyltransferase [Thermoleophilaceae bacterium]